MSQQLRDRAAGFAEARLVAGLDQQSEPSQRLETAEAELLLVTVLATLSSAFAGTAVVDQPHRAESVRRDAERRQDGPDGALAAHENTPCWWRRI